MKSRHTFLAFDCGAISGRAVLASFEEDRFKMKEVYRFPSGIIELRRKCYRDVMSIYGHFRKCLSLLKSEGVHIDSIGIDTWGVDFGFVAEDGTLLGNPRFADPANMLQEIAHQVGNIASDAQIVSCIYHSLAERYREVLDMLQGFAPYKIEKLHIIGGGSANVLLNQWTADAVGIPVVAGQIRRFDKRPLGNAPHDCPDFCRQIFLSVKEIKSIYHE